VLADLLVVVSGFALKHSKHAIVELCMQNNGMWLLRKRNKEVLQGAVVPPVFVSNQLIVLSFICSGKFLNISVPIAKDACVIQDDFRKLKVLLRITSI